MSVVIIDNGRLFALTRLIETNFVAWQKPFIVLSILNNEIIRFVIENIWRNSQEMFPLCGKFIELCSEFIGLTRLQKLKFMTV